MKHRRLHGIGHNFADSLASGVGFVTPMTTFSDVFGEAASGADGAIVVDFLTAKVVGGSGSRNFQRAVWQYRIAFAEFCHRSGADISDFRQFRARYWTGVAGRRYSVMIEDADGKATVVDYEGVPGRRLVELDAQGRRRSRPARAAEGWAAAPLGD